MNWNREKRLRTRSESGSIALGEMLVELLRAPKLLILRGPLGAGKTTLVKGMAQAIGAPAEDVSSPTFTLVHEYRGTYSRRIVHLDLYRLETDTEVESTGLWEFSDRGDALILVEWGERFPSVLARADGEIAIEQGENETERLLHIRWIDR